MPASSPRMFRIEKTHMGAEPGENAQGVDHVLAEVRHRETMKAIGDLKKMVEQVSEGEANAASPEIKFAEMSHELLQDLAEAKKLQMELKEVHDAIEQTKREILSLHSQAVDGKDIQRVSNELGAIVKGTENATESILAAAEEIDQNASQLSAAIKDESLNNAACDIQDQVIKVFEACNFQDLTGQRISKVVSAFSYVDERITKMLEIWGGIESFNNIDLGDRTDLREDSDLLNGPALEEDAGVASQDDIDALFS